jgi:hypothetical protein
MSVAIVSTAMMMAMVWPHTNNHLRFSRWRSVNPSHKNSHNKCKYQTGKFAAHTASMDYEIKTY